jgi:tetratricopeptide (TPR) repeat protein
MRLGGRRGARYYEELMKGADAFENGRDREARRILDDLVKLLPDSASVRELYGLVLYRLGHYVLAAKQLEAFVDITGSVEQHPVLMDCYRGLRRYGPLHGLWEELTAVSPSPDLVTEGRIVLAGSYADRQRLAEAITLLRKRAGEVKRPRLDQVRLWYALADLEVKAGNRSEARELFERVQRYDSQFADVAERLSGLS